MAARLPRGRSEGAVTRIGASCPPPPARRSSAAAAARRCLP